MNNTDKYFKKLLDEKSKMMTKAEISMVNEKIINKFIELYVDKGYDMLIQDCAKLLDVEEKWLVRTLGNEFDYFIAPSPSTTAFSGVNVLNYPKLSEKLGYVVNKNLSGIGLKSYNEVWLKNSKDKRVGLSRKRIFVNRNSFCQFMKKYLVVVNEFKRVAIARNDLNNLANCKLDKIKNEILVDFKLGELKNNGDFRFYDAKVLITNVHLDAILEEKLYSGNTIKSGFVCTIIENSMITKIHDTQLYRWLKRVNVTKITLTPPENKVPVVRYLFPFNINQELGMLVTDSEFLRDNYTFNIPSHVNEKDIINEFLLRI